MHKCLSCDCLGIPGSSVVVSVSVCLSLLSALWSSSAASASEQQARSPSSTYWCAKCSRNVRESGSAGAVEPEALADFDIRAVKGCRPAKNKNASRKRLCETKNSETNTNSYRPDNLNANKPKLDKHFKN